VNESSGGDVVYWLKLRAGNWFEKV